MFIIIIFNEYWTMKWGGLLIFFLPQLMLNHQSYLRHVYVDALVCIDHLNKKSCI